MFSVLLSLAVVFPAPVSPELPVSSPVFAAAPNNQGVPLVATNGDAALAVWVDGRSAAYRLIGSRVDSRGNALDPLGIHFPAGMSAYSLVWDGDEFALFGHSGTQKNITFITLDGQVSEPQPIDVSEAYQFTAVSSTGANARLLFAGLDTSGTIVTRVTNAKGQIVASNAVAGPTTFYNPYLYAVRAGRDSDFILISRNVSLRYSRNGELISTADHHLPLQYFFPENMSIAGEDGNGFVLVRQDTEGGATTLYRLGENGVFTGTSTPLTASPVKYYANNHPAIVHDGDHYVVVSYNFFFNGHSSVDVSFVKPDLSFETHQMFDWVGVANGATVIAEKGFALAFEVANRLYSSSGADLFAQPLGGREPQLVATSATLQGNASIAAGANGYAVAWGENGPDQFRRLYVRRFAMKGEPQDAGPIEVMREPQDFSYPSIPSATVVSNGDAYLISWQTKARRLSAHTGEWIDVAPVDLALSAVGSNGSDAIGIFTRPCANGQACLHAQPLSFHGMLAFAPAIAIGPPGYPYNPAVASNGTDYLVVWSDGWRECFFDPCPILPFRLMAMRIRSDGTAIDAQPLMLDDTQSYPTNPSIAWSGNNYVVAWSTGDQIRATRITSQGAILDHDPSTGGVVLDHAPRYVESLLPLVVAHNRDLVLFVRRADIHSAPLRPVVWEAVQFDDADFRAVAAFPKSVVMTHENDAYGSLSAVSVAGRLTVAYDRVSDPATGRVPRVLLRQFADLARHRAVAH